MTETINVARELAEIRARIEARLSRTVPEIPELALPPLEPLRQARGVVEGWSAAIGGVNFRPPGMLNEVIQAGKKVVARGLRWFTFPQEQFNSGTVAAIVRVEEMFADVNRNMVVMGQNLVDRQRKEASLDQELTELRSRDAAVGRELMDLHRKEAAMLQELADLQRQSAAMRQELTDAQRRDADLLQRIEESETNVQFVLGLLRKQMDEHEANVTDLRTSVGKSLEEMSNSVRLTLEQMSRSTGLGLDDVRGDIGRVEQSVNRMQERVWSDFARFQQKVDTEVRLVRQRLLGVGAAVDSGAAPAVVPGTAAAQQSAAPPAFDYSHFEHRFRGPEESIRKRQALYLPILKDAAPVLDVACGRGEMLELLREQGIAARGVDLDLDMVERCKAKNLPVERADALAYLEAQAPDSLGAVFSAQFIEHLPVAAYARLIELAFARLRPGGRLILETQNPECLAIFSQSFYLDPTHVRPVPPQQVRFLLEEAGFQDIVIHYLSPASEADLPELPTFDDEPTFKSWNAAAERFNETYFRFMDYGIVATKPATQ
jgi:SAM-dependent methyltransferase